MGEEKTNMRNRRLLVRLRVPSMDKMVVAVELGREYRYSQEIVTSSRITLGKRRLLFWAQAQP